MRIKRVDDALMQCDHCVTDLRASNPEVLSLLTQSLLIMICAEFEKEIRNLVRERCINLGDQDVVSYVQNSVDRVVRGVAVSEISGLLGLFGSRYKEEFTEKLTNNGQAVNMYMSIVTNRNNVAHGKDCTATFSDVRDYYENGHLVLDYFRQVLFQRTG